MLCIAQCTMHICIAKLAVTDLCHEVQEWIQHRVCVLSLSIDLMWRLSVRVYAAESGRNGFSKMTTSCRHCPLRRSFLQHAECECQCAEQSLTAVDHKIGMFRHRSFNVRSLVCRMGVPEQRMRTLDWLRPTLQDMQRSGPSLCCLRLSA